MKKIIPQDAVLIPDEAELKFQGMIFDVYQWPQQLFDGSEHTFEMLKRTDTVSAICIVEGKVLVIDDEQPHLGTRKSFPGGRVDDTDASIQDAAQREVLEETGYSFSNWHLVKVFQPYRKMEWFVYVFVAWDATSQQEPKLDPGEKVTVHQLPFEDLKAKVMQDEGYLGESRDIFSSISNIEELIGLPEFKGLAVDR
jgi:ADP-ribose pyrophosphatase